MSAAKKILVTATNYSKICQRGKAMLEEKGFEILENPHGRPMTFEELKEVVGDVYQEKYTELWPE